MAIGFGLLQLSPATFWSLTLKELEAAIRGRSGGTLPADPPSRADFNRLLSLHPDTGEMAQ